ncbi:MARVEL-like domain protein [Pseudohyphozyma bogoriensis]|nr:MARVEL-like domain protein [Pseudohyphozyma bogoriensis]
MSEASYLPGRAPGLVIFVLLGGLAIADLVLTAILISRYNDAGSGWPNQALLDRVRFLLFSSCWSTFWAVAWFVGLVNDPYRWVEVSRWCSLTWLVSTIFWVSGSAALSSSLNSSDSICGDPDFTHCDLLHAIEGVSWANFGCCLLGTLVMFFAGAISAHEGELPPRFPAAAYNAGVGTGYPLTTQPNPYLVTAERPVAPYVEPGFAEPVIGTALDGRMGPYAYT